MLGDIWLGLWDDGKGIHVVCQGRSYDEVQKYLTQDLDKLGLCGCTYVVQVFMVNVDCPAMQMLPVCTQPPTPGPTS